MTAPLQVARQRRWCKQVGHSCECNCCHLAVTARNLDDTMCKICIQTIASNNRNKTHPHSHLRINNPQTAISRSVSADWNEKPGIHPTIDKDADVWGKQWNLEGRLHGEWVQGGSWLVHEENYTDVNTHVKPHVNPRYYILHLLQPFFIANLHKTVVFFCFGVQVYFTLTYLWQCTCMFLLISSICQYYWKKLTLLSLKLLRSFHQYRS